MASHWGVDSLLPANMPIATLPGKPVLYDYLVAKTGREPTFWGRYIVGAPNQVLTQTEASFLLAKGCRILPIYNQATPAGIQGDVAAGRNDATKAITAASGSSSNPDQITIPDGVVVYADIEPLWKPSKAWILGWWDGMWRSRLGKAGGLYCNGHPINTFFTFPYCQAIAEAKAKNSPTSIETNSFLWAQTPPGSCGSNPATMTFLADSPKCHPKGARVWQDALSCLGGSWA